MLSNLLLSVAAAAWFLLIFLILQAIYESLGKTTEAKTGAVASFILTFCSFCFGVAWVSLFWSK